MKMNSTAQTVKNLFQFTIMMIAVCLMKGVEEQLFRVKPVSVQVKPGEDVFLQCVVDNQRGNVQWTKDGFALGFEREVPGYPRYHYFGDGSRGEHHLLIEGAAPQDDGEYQCQVGPASTSSAIWAAANVTVVGASARPAEAPECPVISGYATGEALKEGERRLLKCHAAGGNPRPRLTWHRRGRPLNPAPAAEASPSMRTEEEEEGVSVRQMVRATREEDGAVYECRAGSRLLQRPLVASVTLAVHYGPVWLDEPTSVVDVVEGEDLIITVAAEANPPPVRYTWWRGPLPVEGTTTEGGSGQLRMTTVHRQDAGTYSVTATNTHGVLNSSFTINVLYGPENVVAPERVTVDEGGAATVWCSAVGNPIPNITWTRNPFNSTWWNEEWWGVGEASLVVEEASRMDTALYYCQASNSVSSAPPVATAVVVTQAPTPPVYEEETLQSRLWAALGGGARLACRVLAAPPPTFKWTINSDRVLLNSHKYFVRLPQLVDGLLEWSSVLEIRKVIARDYTQYSCTAINSRGLLTTNYTLYPPMPPTPPTHLQVATVNAKTISLSWTSNDTEALGYTVRYQVAGSSDYEFMDVRGSNASSAIIDGLTSGAEYYFAIQSYNEQGRSHYTSPAIVVTMFHLEEVVHVSADMEDGTANSNSSNLDHSPLPRLILLLLSLTGAALLVLNVAIIVCFLRRRVIKRSTSGSSDKTTVLDTFAPLSTSASAGRLPVDSSAHRDNQEVMRFKIAVNAEETVLVGHRDTTSPTGSHKAVPLPPKVHSTPEPSKEQVTKETRQLQPMSPVSQHHNREAPHIQVTPPYPSHQVKTDLSQSHTTPPIGNGSPGSGSSIPSNERETGMFKKGTVTLHNDLLDETICMPSSDNATQEKNSVYKRVSGISSNIPDVCLKSYEPYEPFMCYLEKQTDQEYTAADQASLSSQLSSDSHANINQHPKRSSSYPVLPHCNNTNLSSKPIAQVIYHGQPHIQQLFEEEQQNRQLKEQKTHQQHSMQQPDHQLHQPLDQHGHYSVQQHQHSHNLQKEHWQLHSHQNEHLQDLSHPPHLRSHQIAHDHSCDYLEWQPLQQYHQHTYEDQHPHSRHQLPLQQHYQQLQKLEEHQQLHCFEDHLYHEHHSGEQHQLYSTEDDQHCHHLHRNEGQQRQLQQHERKPAYILPLTGKQYHKDLECCKLESYLCYQVPQRHPHYMQEPSQYKQSSRQACKLLQYNSSVFGVPKCESSSFEQPLQCNASHLSKYYVFPSKCCDERCRQASLGEVT